LEESIRNRLGNKFKRNDFGKEEEIGDYLSVSPHRRRNGEEEEMYLFRELCYSKLAFARESQ
jgi:hypothetical protein